MSRFSAKSLMLAFALSTAVLPLQAQIFLLRVQQGQEVANVADGGTIAMAAPAIGQPATATLTITYRGATTVSLNNYDYTGSLEFSVSGVPDLPFTLSPNQTLTLGIRYLPGSSNRTVGRMSFSYLEGRTAGTIILNLAGTAPEFAFSFAPQGGNATPLLQGGTITFPVTAIDTTSNATVIVTNRGTATGVINTVTSTGAAFALSGLPLPRTNVDAGRELRFIIAFTPRQLETSTGTLTVDAAGGILTFNLSGAGSGPAFSYEVVRDGSAAPLAPGQLISLPDALVGERSSVVVRLRNRGNADGRVAVIAVQGAGFALSEVPFLPLTLAPGAGASFTVNFQPTQPGRVPGRLRVGDDAFEVTGNGLGSVLTYAYQVGGATVPVQNNGSVNLTPVAVGRTSSVRFLVTNTGTAASPINAISVTGTVYTLSEVPALPASIPAEGTISFVITLTPTAVGPVTATLRVDNQTFTLNGSALNPAPLPEYRFEGPTGNQPALQQPAVGLSLASAYALPISGTLTLTFSSEVFSNDPAVQFAPGGRTVSFSIPANSTRAVFPDGSNQVRLQTGTVAGTITLTPSFVTEGGINLTPATPTTLNMRVAPAAPVLLGVALAARTNNSFTLLVSGYATNRSVTQLRFQFTATQGERLQTNEITVPVEAPFLGWYANPQSQAFGSLFSASIPFTLTGEVSASGLTLFDTIQSVSVTATNAVGTSAARSLSLR